MIIDGTYYMNINCRACRHRHPAHVTCAQAKRIAAEERQREYDAAVAEKAAFDQSQVSAAPPGPGLEHVPLPPSAGKIVGMIVFNDHLYVAFEYGVYRRSNHPGVRNGWEQILP